MTLSVPPIYWRSQTQPLAAFQDKCCFFLLLGAAECKTIASLRKFANKVAQRVLVTRDVCPQTPPHYRTLWSKFHIAMRAQKRRERWNRRRASAKRYDRWDRTVIRDSGWHRCLFGKVPALLHLSGASMENTLMVVATPLKK